MTYILIYSNIILLCFCIADFFNSTCENEANNELINNKISNKILLIAVTYKHNSC